LKLHNLTGRWRGRSGRKVGGGGTGESRVPADWWGGDAVQHGRSTHGNIHVDGYGAVKECNRMKCVEVMYSGVHDVNVLIISGQLQIILIELTRFWCAQIEDGSSENVSVRLFYLQCSRTVF
jgi:hypothetical protein